MKRGYEQMTSANKIIDSLTLEKIFTSCYPNLTFSPYFDANDLGI
jgi:hypothetical protein